MTVKFMSLGAALALAPVAFADVVSLNSSKALCLYDGGSDPFLLSAWSYSGGTEQENKEGSFKSWISFDNSPVTRSWIQGAELTITQYNNSQIAIPEPVTIDLYALTDTDGDAWTDSMVWADAPGNDAASSRLLDPTKTLLVGSLTITDAYPARGTVLTFPLNGDGVSFLKNDPNAISTFIMAADEDHPFGTGLQAYASSSLIIAIPEPTVVGGLFAASLGLLVRKRKAR